MNKLLSKNEIPTIQHAISTMLAIRKTSNLQSFKLKSDKQSHKTSSKTRRSITEKPIENTLELNEKIKTTENLKISEDNIESLRESKVKNQANPITDKIDEGKRI